MYADILQKFRKKAELTQEIVAHQLGISRPTYIQLEQGKRGLTLNEAEKLAKLFKLSLEDFLAGVDNTIEVNLEKKSKAPKKESIRISIPQKNLKKFKEVLLYILVKVGSKPNVGEAVLHKLLYFIDFDFYEKFEEQLIGANYIKNHHGPTSVEFKKIVDEMQEEKSLEKIKTKYFTYDQTKYLPIREPDLSILSGREIEHIEEVLARLSNKSAKEMENYSHDDIPWKTAEEGKPIAYESVFYRDERYSVRNYADEL
jgi:DNA-binding XRE family transcriptional regulator